jgi:cell division protein FtsI (penicillin-binding protein 3)
MTKWVRLRLIAAAVVLTGLFGALAAKTWTVQIRDGEKLVALGHDQWLHEVEIPAPRGTILDANGVELAVTVNVDSAVAYPREVVDVAEAAGRTARALGMDVRDVEEKLASSRQFEWLKRRLAPDEARRVRELGVPGVRLVPEPRRFYPGGPLAGPVLGFAGRDGKGLDGVELALDAHLLGESARMNVIRDRRGDMVMATDLDPRGAVAPPSASAGATVVLTIDRFVQFIAERALAAGVRDNKAKAGTAVVMDPRTGEILAMASSPTCDPNDPGSAKEGRNRPVVDAYEPGSVMKVFSIVTALDAGAVKPDDPIDVEGGKLQIGKRIIRDAHHGPSILSVTEVVKTSSNVGATKIARKLGRDKLAEGLIGLGFGKRTGIQLPGEAAGRVRPPETWGEAGLATVSYGYGMQATPLQIASAFSAIANGGQYLPPTVVKKIVDSDGKVVFEHSPRARRVLGERAARQMVEMLKQVMMKGGTGEKIVLPGFVLAGKTGTARKLDPATKQYSMEHYMSSFMGFAPADDPRLLILVMIDEPHGGQYYGGSVAGPVFVAIAGEVLKYFGVAADAPIVAPQPPAAHLPPAASSAPDEPEIEILPDDDVSVIPDFTGLSVGQAVDLARARGVKIEVEGTGRAVRQFPAPGRALKSITCHVTFDPG